MHTLLYSYTTYISFIFELLHCYKLTIISHSHTLKQTHTHAHTHSVTIILPQPSTLPLSQYYSHTLLALSHSPYTLTLSLHSQTLTLSHCPGPGPGPCMIELLHSHNLLAFSHHCFFVLCALTLSHSYIIHTLLHPCILTLQLYYTHVLSPLSSDTVSLLSVTLSHSHTHVLSHFYAITNEEF